jgi:hypothetical protein
VGMSSMKVIYFGTKQPILRAWWDVKKRATRMEVDSDNCFQLWLDDQGTITIGDFLLEGRLPKDFPLDIRLMSDLCRGCPGCDPPSFDIGEGLYGSLDIFGKLNLPHDVLYYYSFNDRCVFTQSNPFEIYLNHIREGNT